MPTRKETLFASRQKAAAARVEALPATVSFSIDKKRRALRQQSPYEKMLCVFRKILAEMSDADENRCRYYIANNKVQVLRMPSAPAGRTDQPGTYQGAGRAKLGVLHPKGHTSTKYVEFSISFKDTVDERGLPDVVYVDPTTIDEIKRGSPIDLSAIA